MTDIVNRLRACAFDKDGFPRMRSERCLTAGDAADAADEIERLREQIAELERMLARWHGRFGASPSQVK
jgi:hypothetical protein